MSKQINGSSILSVKNISKKFGDKPVLRDVSFEVNNGEIVGFVGRNGSGKTTTIKIILGLLQKSGGEILINGESVKFGGTTINKFVGYLPDVPEFYNYLRPKEYLLLHAQIAGIENKEQKNRVDELLNLVGLDTNKKIGTFSRGMKQRLGMAQALIARPKLLICDEPTSALDPMGRHDLLETLRRIKKETAVLFSTHILTDVERISDKIVVLEKGVIQYEGNVENLKTKNEGTDRLRITVANQDDINILKKQFGKKVISAENLDLVLRYTNKQSEYFEIIDIIKKSKIIPRSVEIVEPDLEQLFMEMAK